MLKTGTHLNADTTAEPYAVKITDSTLYRNAASADSARAIIYADGFRRAIDRAVKRAAERFSDCVTLEQATERVMSFGGLTNVLREAWTAELVPFQSTKGREVSVKRADFYFGGYVMQDAREALRRMICEAVKRTTETAAGTATEPQEEKNGRRYPDGPARPVRSSLETRSSRVVYAGPYGVRLRSFAGRWHDLTAWNTMTGEFIEFVSLVKDEADALKVLESWENSYRRKADPEAFKLAPGQKLTEPQSTAFLARRPDIDPETVRHIAYTGPACYGRHMFSVWIGGEYGGAFPYGLTDSETAAVAQS